MQSGDHTWQLAHTLGRLQSQGDRLIYVAELGLRAQQETLQEVREMRSEAAGRHREAMSARPSPDIPPWDRWVKDALRWALPFGVLWQTGSLEKALSVLKALQ